ncbi:MAG: tRNA (adenosine(37)-N6)-dimethylallyltransferase MiaA [Oscillospiraceae bacterium]|nr:tRNA (adenosine(37)-N6)-dimethylallyltransferase MiaA [Oscillospiraceae bacterium]
MIKVIVICGPTASGKTKLAVEVAKAFGGEVVSADSMQIYKGLDILTAKPTAEEMQGIPHHMIDFLPPDKGFSVAEYVKMAGECIEDIHARGKLPVIAGGTGLYIDSLVDGIDFESGIADSTLRSQLEEEARTKGKEHMHQRLCALDPKAADSIHPNNLIRVIRAIEINLLTGATVEENKIKSREKGTAYEPLLIGLFPDRAVLYDRIDRRVDEMMAAGAPEEARRVYEKYDTRTAFNAIGYKELIPYIRGEASLDECTDNIKLATRHYAKRQLTWFRRDVRIQRISFDNYEHFDEIVKNCMNIVEMFKKT